MRTIIVLMICITIGLSYSCKKNANHAVDTAEAEKEARQTILTLGMTPDSLRSPEQKLLVNNLELILHDCFFVKNNHLEVSISKKEFETMGVPEIYYDILKKDINDINHYLDTTTSIVYTAEFFKKSIDENFAVKERQQVE